MKRWFSLFLAAVLLLLTACGAGGSDSSAANGGGAVGSVEEGSWDLDMSGDNIDSSTMSRPGVFDTVAPEAPQEPAGTQAAGERRKVIYTASIRMETTDFETAFQALGHIVEACSGYFESRSVINHDASRSGQYTVRVPAEQFETFCAQVGQVCHVTELNTGEENVSEAYYDIEARLTTQRTKLARLQELLSKADSMADIITIESAISDTELQIEYLTGSLRHYDALIDYATITLTLWEVYRLSSVPETPPSFGGRMAEALRSGLDGAIALAEGTAVALAHIWVLLIVLLPVVAAVFVSWRKKRRAEQAAETEEKK